MQLKRLFVFVFLPVFSFAQTTPAQLESDISNKLASALSGDLVALEAFPVNNGTLAEAMAIHAAHITTNETIAAVTNDIDNASCPLSDSDANAILDLLNTQVQRLQEALMDAIAREPALKALGVVPIFQGDFAFLQASSDAMALAIAGCISSNVLPKAEAIKSAIDAAFASAESAFN